MRAMNEHRASDQRLQTIRGLLAKAEATPYPDEAAAFTAKASQLMGRYAIDESAVWASSDERSRGQPIEILLTMHRPYLSPKAILVSEVAQASGCQAIRFSPPPGSATEQIAVIGFAPDVEIVETLVTSLLVQIAGAMPALQPGGLTSAETKSWRRSFLTGFTESVAQRLRAGREAATAESEPVVVGDRSTSMEMVLADRQRDVRDDVRRRYPRLRTTRVSPGSSVAGRSSGRFAGQRADLGGRRVEGAKAGLGR